MDAFVKGFVFPEGKHLRFYKCSTIPKKDALSSNLLF